MLNYICIHKYVFVNAFSIIGVNTLTVNSAVAKRIDKLLKEKNMSIYRLERNSGIIHGAINRILDGKNKTVTLTTVYSAPKSLKSIDGISIRKG